MAHKCFISFKTQDHDYKRYIHDYLEVDMIDKSLHEPINFDNEDYILRKTLRISRVHQIRWNSQFHQNNTKKRNAYFVVLKFNISKTIQKNAMRILYCFEKDFGLKCL